MQKAITTAQAVVSLLLIVFVLLQKSKGGLFGSDNRFYQSLRGVEKKIFVATIILGILLIALAILNLLL